MLLSSSQAAFENASTSFFKAVDLDLSVATAQMRANEMEAAETACRVRADFDNDRREACKSLLTELTVKIEQGVNHC